MYLFYEDRWVTAERRTRKGAHQNEQIEHFRRPSAVSEINQKGSGCSHHVFLPPQAYSTCQGSLGEGPERGIEWQESALTSSGSVKK